MNDEPTWKRFLTEQDRMVVDRAGYGSPAGPGRRPALVIIDFNYDFAGAEPMPVAESIRRWHSSSGTAAWDAVAPTRRLLQVARHRRIPIFYSNIERRADNWDSGLWKLKNTRNHEPSDETPTGDSTKRILDQLAPFQHEIVIWKHRPSIFHGTVFLSHLIELRVDTLIFAGGTTSGCVRASVTDAFSNNLRSLVVEDACFDRFESSHAMSLFDLNAKYADVVSTLDATRYIDEVPDDLFLGLPTRAGES